MQPGIRFHPVKKRIDHRIAFIEIHTLELEIPPQDIQTRWIFAGSQPVQVQTAPFSCNAGLVTFASRLPVQVW